MKTLLILAFFLLCALGVRSKKSILDYSEADVERIFREWEENDPDDDDDDDDDDMLKPPFQQGEFE